MFVSTFVKRAQRHARELARPSFPWWGKGRPQGPVHAWENLLLHDLGADVRDCRGFSSFLRQANLCLAAEADVHSGETAKEPVSSSFENDHDSAARRAYSELVSTILRQASATQGEGGHDDGQQPFEFEGLHLFDEQQSVHEGHMSGKGLDVNPSHIQRSLAAIQYHQSLMDGTPKGRRLQKNWQRQITLETRAVDAAIARYKREAEAAMKRGAAATLPPARKLLVNWFKPLAEAIQEEQYKIANGSPGIDRSVYGPYLLQLDPEQLAVITMHAAMNCFMSPENEGDAVGARPGATRMTKLSTAIGKAVEAQHHIDRLEAEIHERNMRVKEVRNIYDEGRALRAAYEDNGDLTTQEWKEWFDIGSRLRDLGEMLPLDHLEWFKDVSVETRVQKLTKQFQKEASSQQEMRVMSQRAKRLLADAPNSIEWRPEMQAKVGVILIKLLTESCKIDSWRDGRLESVPAFWHKLEQGPDPKLKGVWKRYGLLMADQEVMKRIKPHHMTEAFMPQFLPMVVPPVPWQRRNLGGHLTLRTSVMRVRGSAAQRQRLEEADKSMIEGTSDGLSPVYESLNALGETAWSINQDVYKVVEAIWAWGGGICEIPPRTDVVEPRILKPGFRIRRINEKGPMYIFSIPKADVSASYYNAQRAKKKNNELHSLRCDMEYKLAIAREFSHEERFYFPHNVDFRGRAYPMHPHLNHLGSDMCRGLLQFAEERPLGPNGLRWLYIQAANLWGKGIDKLSLDGRVKWVEGHIGSIIDNATDPFAYDGSLSDLEEHLGIDLDEDASNAGSAIINLLKSNENPHTKGGGAAVWYKAEAPFQFLATCFDIYRALSCGDPASYRSRLPVHQDGSCNGLQHYAALGRDLSGGWAVNLCPVDRPQDVYSEISRLVAKRVEADAASGVPEAQTLLKSTEIDRKLVKQTVMTSVYGVTFVGARAQIGNRLKERGFEDNHAMYKVSCYSARVTLDCLHEMFQSAKHIMQWLSECARLIAKEGRVVTWTTPLGLPVVQPYRRKTQQHVRTVLQRLVLATEHDTKPVMKQRQRTAFPPNYIHSIDSSHMMMTAVACREQGLDFAGVHDSFWTHAGHVDQMNYILRSKFIDLHSQPLLETLLEELQKEHPDIVFPPLPPRGDLDLEEIKSAQYFFS